ncbi:MAG: hypothetical protein N2323_00625 [candidate division WOR-3 bacterium]|nr:hypothetical protein [candidate division WOR-3 bacterium]MCX7836449.1 hypothetical protein [candidate division WOR-3 bacterium]MDW8114206.1 hypothetical protein [candidate division WOR-3 bacterium]
MNFLLIFTLINGLILTEPPTLNEWKEISFELEGNYYKKDNAQFGYLLSFYLGLPFSSEFSFDISYEKKEWDFVLYYKKGFETLLFKSALRVGIDKDKNLLSIGSLGREFTLLNLYGCGGFFYEKKEKKFFPLFGLALEKSFSNLLLTTEFYKEKEDKIITLGINYSLSILDIYTGIRKNFSDGNFIFNFGIGKSFSF